MWSWSGALSGTTGSWGEPGGAGFGAWCGFRGIRPEVHVPCNIAAKFLETE